MKSTKSRILLVFLANLILLNSFGFGLVEHSCSMRGKKSYSFITQESCKGCDKQHNKHTGKTVINKTKCCDDKEIEQEDISKSIVNVGAKVVKSTSEFIANSIVWVVQNAFIAIFNILGYHPTGDDSNSFSGKSLLIFICLFRL